MNSCDEPSEGRSERLFAFNCRVVSDSTVYVKACSSAEAERNLRGGYLPFSSSDENIVSVTYRRLPTADEGLPPPAVRVTAA